MKVKSFFLSVSDKHALQYVVAMLLVYRASRLAINIESALEHASIGCESSVIHGSDCHFRGEVFPVKSGGLNIYWFLTALMSYL